MKCVRWMVLAIGIGGIVISWCVVDVLASFHAHAVALPPQHQERAVDTNNGFYDVLPNPNWQAVPGTYSDTLGDSAYVDQAGLNRQEMSIVFDVVNPDVGYTRLEGNCTSGELRVLRQGYFETLFRVVYRRQTQAPWRVPAPDSLEAQVFAFACQLSPSH